MRTRAFDRLGRFMFGFLTLALFAAACGEPADIEEGFDSELETTSQALETTCSLGDVQWGSAGVCSGDWRYVETQCARPSSCNATNECEAPGNRRDEAPASTTAPVEVIVNLSYCPMEDPAEIGCVIPRPREPRPARPCRNVCQVTDNDRATAQTVCQQRGEAAFRAQYEAQLRDGSVVFGSTTAGIGFGRRQGNTQVFNCTATTSYTTVTNTSVCNLCAWANCTPSNRTGFAGTTLSGLRASVAPANTGRSIASEVCSSCDDSPLAADGSNAAAKFDCLASQGSALGQQRMQMIYELFGRRLSAAQRALAQATYTTPAPQFATCSPSATFACSTPAQRTQLNECERLAAGHADLFVTTARFDVCMDALKQVADTAGCTSLESDVQRAREIAKKLVDKLSAYSDPSETASTASLREAALRRTYLLGQWWRTAQHLSAFETDGVARAERDLGEVLANFWKYAARSVSLDTLRSLAAQENTSDATLKATLGDVIANGMGNRAVLDVLLEPASAVRLPDGVAARNVSTLVEGEALLQLLVDAAQWNVDRAEALTSAHDLSCLFADCAKNQPATELVQFWWLVSKLATPETAGEPFRSFRRGSLLETLAFMRRDAFTAAIARARSEDNDFQVGKRRFDALVERGTTRYANYRSHGLLRGDLSRTLSDAVDEAGAQRIGGFVREDAERFASANELYREDLKRFLAAITSDVSSGVSLDVALSRRDYYVSRHAQLEEQIEALQASASRADLTFNDLEGELSRIAHVLDKTYTSQVGAAEQLKITRNRSFTHEGRLGVGLPQLRAMAVWSRDVAAGHMVQVNMQSEEYSPTCLLRNLKVVDDHQGVGASVGSVFRDVPPTKSLAPSGTEVCGPEGFTLVRQAGETTVTAANYEAGVSARAYAGVKSEACGVLSGPLGHASACVYVGSEVSVSASTNSTYSHGVNSQTSVALKDGLRSPYAPFPSAPLGALLLVTEADGQILDIDVASRSGLTAVAPRHATMHLVVNDLSCDESAGTPGLDVTVRELQTEQAAASAAVQAIAAVRTKLRAQTTFYVNQRMMLTGERAAEQAKASWELNAQLAARNLRADAMPVALRELFEAVVSHEMSRIDRVLEIARLERERQVQLEELVALGHEVRAATAVNRLNRILPFWTLQDLRTEQLEARLDVLLRTVREQFMPVLQLWYPSFLETFSKEVRDRTNPNNAVLRLLDELSPERSLADLSLSVQRAISDEIVTRFAQAQRTRTSADRYEYIAISIPNPEHRDHRGRTGPAWGSTLSYPTLDEVSSAEVWAQIREGGIGEFTITPELVYSRIGARPGVVDCSVSTPIVRKMLLSMVRPGATDIETNNALRYKSRVTAGRDNWVAQESGLSRFELAEGAWTDMGLLVTDSGVSADGRVTVPNDVLYRLLGSSTREDAAGRDIGISPFGTFSVDFFGWNTRRDWVSRYDVVEGDFVPAASELVVVMAIDTKPTANGKSLPWLTTCPGARPPQ